MIKPQPQGCVPFLPFVSLHAVIAVKPPYKEELITIGDHVRKARLDRGLNLKKASKVMGVDDESIINWEKRYKEPGIKSMAKIISFLGYIPFDDEANQTLGRRLLRFRLTRGISKKRLAKQLNIDPTTINRIEENRDGLNAKTYIMVRKFLNQR